MGKVEPGDSDRIHRENRQKTVFSPSYRHPAPCFLHNLLLQRGRQFVQENQHGGIIESIVLLIRKIGGVHALEFNAFPEKILTGKAEHF